ncbi:hypothetical protein MRX96_019594 [Rhipicephalus microplus]
MQLAHGSNTALSFRARQRAFFTHAWPVDARPAWLLLTGFLFPFRPQRNVKRGAHGACRPRRKTLSARATSPKAKAAMKTNAARGEITKAARTASLARPADPAGAAAKKRVHLLAREKGDVLPRRPRAFLRYSEKEKVTRSLTRIDRANCVQHRVPGSLSGVPRLEITGLPRKLAAFEFQRTSPDQTGGQTTASHGHTQPSRVLEAGPEKRFFL